MEGIRRALVLIAGTAIEQALSVGLQHEHCPHSAIQFQGNSTERPPTPNGRRGSESELEITMHSLPTTIRTLLSAAGLQAQGVW